MAKARQLKMMRPVEPIKKETTADTAIVPILIMIPKLKCQQSQVDLQLSVWCWVSHRKTHVIMLSAYDSSTASIL